MVKEISSVSNPLIKELTKIKNDARFRYQKQIVLLEGEKLIKDVASITPRITLFAEEEKWIKMFPTKESYLISPKILKKLSALENPEGVIAVVKMPLFKEPKTLQRLLILDRIQDPGNLGTLVRTAYALFFDAAFLLKGTVDPFNDKTIRAAKGSTFRLPLLKGSFEQVKKIVEAHDLTLVAGDMEGKCLDRFPPPKALALILGNEGSGISEELFEGSERIAIPMREGAESLNVAASGAILMYALSSRR